MDMPHHDGHELHCPVRVAKARARRTWLLTLSAHSVGNVNPAVQTAPLPILSQENTFDCSKQLDSTQLNFGAGDGYFVQLANPFNNTDVRISSLHSFSDHTC